jgi:hypothetical protein
MSWMDDDNAESKRQQESAAELAARHATIANSAEKIYNDLWDEIVSRIAEAKSKGRPVTGNLLTNGDPFERRIGHRIIVPQPIKPPAGSSDPKEVIVRLTKDRLKIEVLGLTDAPLYFPFDLCDDGIVQIKHDGEHVTVQEAARSILRRLLFPELFG